MSDEIQYIELRQRDPQEAVLLMASTVAAQKRELTEIRAVLGMPLDAPHAKVIAELSDIRTMVAEIRAMAEALSQRGPQ